MFTPLVFHCFIVNFSPQAWAISPPPLPSCVWYLMHLSSPASLVSSSHPLPFPHHTCPASLLSRINFILLLLVRHSKYKHHVSHLSRPASVQSWALLCWINLSCFLPVLHMSYASSIRYLVSGTASFASILSCNLPILHPPYPASFPTPITCVQQPPTCATSVLPCICPVLHPPCPASVLSCIHPSCIHLSRSIRPLFALSFIRPVLSFIRPVLSFIRPVLHPSCPASALTFIRPVLHSHCPSSALSYISPVLHPPCPSSALSSIHPPCPSSALSFIRPLLHPPYPSSALSFIRPFLHPPCPSSILYSIRLVLPMSSPASASILVTCLLENESLIQCFWLNPDVSGFFRQSGSRF